MGVFASTDMLTQLPIQEGDPVVAFIMAYYLDDTAHLPFGPSSPNARYRLVSPPLSGTYNGYGWIDNTQPGFANNMACAYFTALGVSDVCFDDFYDLLSELNSTSGKDPFTDARLEVAPLSYAVALVHADLYTQFINHARIVRDCSRKTIGQLAVQEVDAFFAGIHTKEWGHEFRGTTDRAMSAYMRVNETFQRITDWSPFDYLADHRYLVETGPSLVKFFIFLEGMRLGRRSFQPQSGMGVTTVMLPFHRAFLQSAVEFADEQIEAERIAAIDA